jgi:GT2 family glycosyltransferase
MAFRAPSAEATRIDETRQPSVPMSLDATKPAVSVVVATRNRSARLRTLLPQLEASGAAAAVATEIIVVDNASNDDTPAVLSTWAAKGGGRRHLCEPRPGKSRALNLALRQASGTLLVFTDDDVRVPVGWVGAVWCFFENHPHYAAAMGRVCVPPDIDPELRRRIERLPVTQPLFDLGDSGGDAPEIYGCNMAVRRSTFDVVGTFDERLGPAETGLCEDTELGSRIRNAGLRIGYMPEVLIYHLVDPDRISKSAFRDFHVRWARSIHVLNPDKANLGCLWRWLDAAWWRLFWRVLRNPTKATNAWGRMIRHAELLRIRMARRPGPANLADRAH